MRTRVIAASAAALLSAAVAVTVGNSTDIDWPTHPATATVAATADTAVADTAVTAVAVTADGVQVDRTDTIDWP